MKWKRLYQQSMRFISFAGIVIGGISSHILGTGTVNTNVPYKNYGDSLQIFFRRDGNAFYRGYYAGRSDMVTVHQWISPEVILHERGDTYDFPYHITVAHEIKHALNAAKLGFQINTNANELSAFAAGNIAAESIRSHLLAAADSLRNRMQESDFISRPNTKSRAQQEMDKIINEVSGRFFPTKDTVIMMERDINYNLSLDQQYIDRILLNVIDKWEINRNVYKWDRASDIAAKNTFTSDADLEKLFTFKINGIHRSLYREASPQVRAKVRQIVNSDNLIFMAKRALGRE